MSVYFIPPLLWYAMTVRYSCDVNGGFAMFIRVIFRTGLPLVGTVLAASVTFKAVLLNRVLLTAVPFTETEYDIPRYNPAKAYYSPILFPLNLTMK